VPDRYIGVAGPSESSQLLKALALYLSSDVALYHRFFTSPEWGTNATRITMNALRELPIPFAGFSDSDLRDWTSLHGKLVACESPRTDVVSGLAAASNDDPRAALLAELNALVNEALQLSKREQWVVSDFIEVRMRLLKGKISEDARVAPSGPEITEYARVLKHELDAFIEDSSQLRHDVCLLHSEENAIIGVDLRKGARSAPAVLKAGTEEAKELDRVRRALLTQHSQWVYFDRALRVYEGTSVHFMKPLKRLHWTRTQAMLDAGQIISETISGARA
jgi:hypothetical protein